jgi:hypothetical protein
MPCVGLFTLEEFMRELKEYSVSSVTV